ncbi:MAG: hypothetical protein WB992_10660 [Bryobacteraceae bacterium]
MQRGPVLSATPNAAIILVSFVCGFTAGLFYLGHWHVHWDNRIDWSAISNLAGAAVNAVVVLLLGLFITTRLQQQTFDRRFEKELLITFTKTALTIAEQINTYFVSCTTRESFTAPERDKFVSLFGALGQEIQLTKDAIERADFGRSSTTVNQAQICRGEYKDLLTDHSVGKPFTNEDVRAAQAKYREIRNSLIQVIFEINRTQT